MSVGFMSEHTAEFLLVPDIVRRLEPAFPHIVPFYYWASREGSRIVAASDSSYIRLVAVYGRRPKVGMYGQPRVLMKVNKELFDHAAIFKGYGIPVLAGLPCVSRLTDCTSGAACAWFFLDPCGGAYEDEYLELDIRQSERAVYEHGPIRGPLSTEELQELVFERSTVMAWPEALGQIRSAARTLSRDASLYRYRRFGWPTAYKPFYLALVQCEGRRRLTRAPG